MATSRLRASGVSSFGAGRSQGDQAAAESAVMSSNVPGPPPDADQALADAGGLRCASVSGRARCWPGGVMRSWCRPGWRHGEHAASMTWKAARALHRPVGRRRTTGTTPPPSPTSGAKCQRVLRVATPGRGSTRGRPPDEPASAPPPARALRLQRTHRMESVSSPFSTTQALNGDSTMPAFFAPAAELRAPSPRARTVRRHHAVPPVEELGARMHHDVGAERRTLQRRRGEAVVHREQRAGAARDVGERRDVADLGQRVGRRLGEQQLRVGRSARRARRRRRFCGTKVDSTPNLRELGADEFDRRAEHRLREHDVVARAAAARSTSA